MGFLGNIKGTTSPFWQIRLSIGPRDLLSAYDDLETFDYSNSIMAGELDVYKQRSRLAPFVLSPPATCGALVTFFCTLRNRALQYSTRKEFSPLFSRAKLQQGQTYLISLHSVADLGCMLWTFPCEACSHYAYVCFRLSTQNKQTVPLPPSTQTFLFLSFFYFFINLLTGAVQTFLFRIEPETKGAFEPGAPATHAGAL